jgi:tripartite-type tricarboxylate transporter receptor subunit TctC
VESEGLVIQGGSPQDFDKYAKGEEARWRKVVKENNITAE